MKHEIHPKMYPLSVQFTNGDIFEMYSTYNKGKITLEVDMHNHVAWTAKASDNSTSDKVRTFKSKFQGLSILSDGKKK